MDGIALMATAMRAEKNRLDISASNLANVSTDGFRKHVARISLGAGGLTTSSRSDPEQGPLRHTGRNFDLSIAGDGAFFVRDTARRIVEEHSGSFERDAYGRLVDERGRVLLGPRGPVVVSPSATIDARGIVRDAGSIAGSLQLSRGSVVQSGFLEGANVDAVREMVDVLEAQRAFESDEKTLSAIDEARQKDVNDVVRVKS
jgi:flagellar basal-body rod protein FlgG